jgi:hypothetical protein
MNGTYQFHLFLHASSQLMCGLLKALQCHYLAPILTYGCVTMTQPRPRVTRETAASH